MSKNKLKITNGRILTPYRIIQGGTILVNNGKIEGISERNIEAPEAIEIDAAGQYIAPGFIDMHIHGGGGYDFMDGSVEAFLRVAEIHARFGTTSMVPTTLTSEKEELINTLQLYESAHALNVDGASFLGMHIEGPYFAMKQRGAQDPRYIRDPDPDEYREIVGSSSAIARWSAAPEKSGAMEFGRFLLANGILPSVAHTDAVYEEVIEAFENGYTLATHLYSAMSGVTRRDAFRFAGVIESAFLIDEMSVEIIADGVHLPPPLLKLVYKIKGPDRIALITDAMRAAAMPPGPSILGSLKDGIEVIVEDDVAKLPDRSAFAGSVATTDRLVRNMVQLADIPLLDAVRMMSTTPASIMKVDDRKGTLVQGKDADIVIFDEQINVSKTIINGKLVFDKSQQLQSYNI